MKWLVLLLAVGTFGCSRPGGGGGSEVGNGGEPDFVKFEHGLQFARAALGRIQAQPSLRSLDEKEVGRLREWLPKLQNVLKPATLVHEDGLPEFCRCDRLACARSGDTVIYVDRRRSHVVRDYRDAAGLLWHEAVHLAGEADERVANDVAALLLRAWKGLGHPEAPHWVPMADAPLTNERINDDPDIIRLQYSDWTGDRFVVWDERAAQFYDPAKDQWELRRATANPLKWRRSKGSFARESHVHAWVDGFGVVVAPCRSGVRELHHQNATGVKLSEKEMTWSKVTAQGAPSERMWLAHAKSPTQLFLWGGAECAMQAKALDDGGIYEPATDRWEAIAPGPGAPAPRYAHAMVWTDSQLAVWGGYIVARKEGEAGVAELTNTGALYDPKTRRWTPIPVTAETPSPRIHPRLAWAGGQLYVFGGFDNFNGKSVRTGGIYDVKTGQWRALPVASERTVGKSIEPHFTYWTGSQFGFASRQFFAFFDPIAGEWNDWGRPAVPGISYYPRFYWTGVEGIFWDPEERRGSRLYP